MKEKQNKNKVQGSKNARNKNNERKIKDK